MEALVTLRRWSRARNLLVAARRDLGQDLGGFSPVDLLLDNMVGVTDSAHARRILQAVDTGFAPEQHVTTPTGRAGRVVGYVHGKERADVLVALDATGRRLPFQPAQLRQRKEGT